MSTFRALPNGIIVNCYNIIGTNINVYEAFEPSSYHGDHSSIQTFNNSVYGKVASRRTGIYENNKNEAVQYILDAFPHLETLEYGINESMGRIETINE
ncbi:hypothetical protein D3C73_278170 [compost metagenome]